MGASRVDVGVADAGPLIHLAEVGALELLRICESVVVPTAVWEETVGRGRVSERLLLDAAAIERRSVDGDELNQLIKEQGLASLHSGEQECLFVCADSQIPVFLTDDLAARDAATHLGLTPVGSMGVIARAYRLGELTLDEAERHILNLQRVSTLFVTEALVDFVLDELRRFQRE